MATRTLIIACFVLLASAQAVLGQTEPNVTQSGNYFPKGVRLGANSEEACIPGASGTLRYNGDSVQVCDSSTNRWSTLRKLQSNETDSIDDKLNQLQADMDVVKGLLTQLLASQGGNNSGVGDNPRDLQNDLFCTGNGVFVHVDDSCNCYNDDIYGHYQGVRCHECLPGWKMDSFGRCLTDENECSGEGSGHNCHTDATCTNTPGTFECTCNTGFSGNGTTCTDDNECLGEGTGHTCSAYGSCANTPGSYSCACFDGFTGDGYNCADIDECAETTHDCGVASACTNVPGGFVCACEYGMISNVFNMPGVPHCRYPSGCHEAAEYGLFFDNHTALIDMDGAEGPDPVELVQCDMDHEGGGWTVVGEIVPSDGCPANFDQVTAAFAAGTSVLCTRRNVHPVFPDGGCDVVSFDLKGSVTAISGFMAGYQRGSMDAFGQFTQQTDQTINGPYVDGFAITTGYPSATEHVWTYAIGASPTASSNACPCHSGGTAPPLFVGNNFYCSTGNPSTVVNNYYSDPLYSAQCTSASQCCADSSESASEFSNFRRDFNTPVAGNTLDFRICSNQEISNEDGGVEYAKFYSRVRTIDPVRPESCSVILERGGLANGFYQIYDNQSGSWNRVYCTQDVSGGGWEAANDSQVCPGQCSRDHTPASLTRILPTSCVGYKDRGAFEDGSYLLSTVEEAGNPGSAYEAFCMQSYLGGGWTQVGHIDPVTDSYISAPLGTVTCENGTDSARDTPPGEDPVCRRGAAFDSTAGCASFTFDSPIPYTEVAGYFKAYAYYSMDAFMNGVITRSDRSVLEDYLDGISVVKHSPGSTADAAHVYSYAVSWSSDAHCPCHGGHVPNSFVGSDYYCDSPSYSPPANVWIDDVYFTSGCSPSTDCCNGPETPQPFQGGFFTTSGLASSSDSIRIGICSDQERSNEDAGISDARIFVR